MVIWANHNLRAVLAAMRMISRRIRKEESLVGIEDEIASIKDVFELTGESELAEAESRYLPARDNSTEKVEVVADPKPAAAPAPSLLIPTS
jgi:phosphoenolpyruvate phosphomutase